MPTLEMTARWIERLKPPEAGRVDYFDSKMTGLGLRVSHTGNRVWFVAFRVKGDPKWRRLTLEPFPAMTLADAREKASQVLLDASRGIDPTEKKREQKQAPTVEWLAKEYLERYAKLKKRSWREDKRIIEHDILPSWGRLKACDIKRRDVIRLLDSILERGSPIQANRTRALISKLFNWAISRDILEANPCAQVPAAATENQRDRVLTEDEIRAVWKAFDDLEAPFGEMFKLRLLTAQRGGEVESMRWQDVDFDTCWWTIPSVSTKNKLSHRVPLSEPAVEILKGLKASTGQQDWVFPAPKAKGKHITVTNGKPAETVRQTSGVQDFTLHDLRRTAASYMTGMGINRLVVSKILNHVESGITRVYDRHSYDREKREALDQWAARLREILNKRPAEEYTDGEQMHLAELPE